MNLRSLLVILAVVALALVIIILWVNFVDLNVGETMAVLTS